MGYNCWASEAHLTWRACPRAGLALALRSRSVLILAASALIHVSLTQLPLPFAQPLALAPARLVAENRS